MSKKEGLDLRSSLLQQNAARHTIQKKHGSMFLLIQSSLIVR